MTCGNGAEREEKEKMKTFIFLFIPRVRRYPCVNMSLSGSLIF